ncbi:MAG: FAD/NAD(P)-binding protein [Chitinispirillaceae bacterium]|nr:FAD/NAD(P)-binding protein [Chitinispirillaceae bacterium]
MCECCGQHDHGSLYLPEPATLVKTSPMTARDRFFEFKLDGHDLGHLPGQFAEISIPGVGEAPVSVSSSPTKKGSFDMVIRNAGRVTAELHKLAPGQKVGVRGPFGTHFAMEEYKGKDLLFLGAGIGLVPLRSAINYALDNRADYGTIFILCGFTDATQRLFTDETEAWKKRPGVVFHETLDRGDASWKGNTGVITTLIPKIKDRINPANTKAFIVGPPVMYKFALLELKNIGFANDDIVVSLERHMKCGVGKCGHCQINGVYVCREGPVFTYASITGLMEAL